MRKGVLWANSEDPDEILHYATFYQGLHCLLIKTKTIFRERHNIIWKSQPVSPQYIQMDHPDFIVSKESFRSTIDQSIKQFGSS